MKKLSLYIFILVLGVSVFYGCKDRTEITAPVQSSKSGDADLSRLVTIGNSITAGYQSSALYENAQMYCFGNLMAQQANTSFAIPYISDPGLGGRIYIQSLTATGVVLGTRGSTGVPKNLTYAAPYNNLGIPGALLYDVMNAKDSLSCASGLAGKPNPLFNLILRGLGTQFQQARALHPTMITLWIGNNDVLGFATSGGVSPSSPTPSALFTALYHQLADSIASIGAKVAVANIPNVTDIPFFTTVGPQLAMKIPWYSGVPGLVFSKHMPAPGYGAVDSIGLLTGKVRITLPGSTYAGLLGDKTGKYYTMTGQPVPPSVNTHAPFGFDPLNPFPDQFVLDSVEQAAAENATTDFNSTILAEVTARPNFVLVDINKVFGDIRSRDYTGGTNYGGITFTTSYITGGLFSLDGVHPTNQGQAVIANEFLKAINAKWGGSFPLVDIGRIPGSITFGKRSFGFLPTFEVPNWYTNLK